MIQLRHNRVLWSSHVSFELSASCGIVPIELILRSHVPIAFILPRTLFMLYVPVITHFIPTNSLEINESEDCVDSDAYVDRILFLPPHSLCSNVFCVFFNAPVLACGGLCCHPNPHMISNYITCSVFPIYWSKVEVLILNSPPLLFLSRLHVRCQLHVFLVNFIERLYLPNAEIQLRQLIVGAVSSEIRLVRCAIILQQQGEVKANPTCFFSCF